MKTIIRSPRGTARREVPIDEVQVPDLWHVYEHMLRTGNRGFAEDILECWHLCHDLLEHIKSTPECWPPATA